MASKPKHRSLAALSHRVVRTAWDLAKTDPAWLALMIVPTVNQ